MVYYISYILTIFTTKADKSYAAMIMNKSDYEEKAIKYLSTRTHLKIDSKNLQVVKNKLRSETSEVPKELKPFISVSSWFTLYPKFNTTSRFYRLPKFHKPDIPLRLIEDFKNTPTSALSKYLKSILKPLQYNVTNFVKDSYEFKPKISESSINKNETVVSCDVSLYTAITTNKYLDFVNGLLVNNHSLSSGCPLSISSITKSLKLCLYSIIFTLKGTSHKQKNRALRDISYKEKYQYFI